MKRIRTHISVALVLLALTAAGMFLVAAATVKDSLTPTPLVPVVSYAVPPLLSAKAVLVVDGDTGESLYERQADEVLPIASVTKLVTAAVFWDAVDQFGTTTITAADVAEDGRAGRLKAGQRYQNRELLFPLLLESSNDAAATIARSAPFDVVAAMNTYASAHGAAATVFADTSGLSDSDVSTAHDLAKLFLAVQHEDTHVLDITNLPIYFNHVNAWTNNNPFIEDPTYRGGKHGYTYAANRTVVASFEEPLTGGTRTLVYVLLGSDDLTADMRTLRSFVKSAVSLR